MLYRLIAESYKKLDATTKRLELINILVDLLKQTPVSIVDKVVYLTQGKLYPDYEGVEIGVADKLCLRTLHLVSGLSLESLEREYDVLGDIGLVAEKAVQLRPQVKLFSKPLTVEVVYETLDLMARTTGEGSLEAKLRHLSGLLADALPLEAKYILRTVTGKLRLGVADYTVLDALSESFAGGVENRGILENAYNITSDLGAIAKAVAVRGLRGVRGFKVRVGKPIRPMLAERLSSAEEVLEKLGGRCAAEYKLDGERFQIHKSGRDVTVFSRRLENITRHYPDAVSLVLRFVKAKEAILEAEAVAVDEWTGVYRPFQELMHRRRKFGVEEAVKNYPIAVNFFDILFSDGEDHTVKPYLERRRILEKTVIEGEAVKIVPMKLSSDTGEIESFLGEAIADGCEGLVIKDVEGHYRAGAREFSWIKLKREYRSAVEDTFDLVIVGAFHGKGRRAGRYGTFLLSAYDRQSDSFRSITKIGTGFTDKDLESFPKLLEPQLLDHKHPRVDSRMEAAVWFRPLVVIEVIASEITLSPIHSCALDSVRKGSGLALRFPKFTGRIRSDKAPEDATSCSEVEQMYRRHLKKIEEPAVA